MQKLFSHAEKLQNEKQNAKRKNNKNFLVLQPSYIESMAATNDNFHNQLICRIFS